MTTIFIFLFDMKNFFKKTISIFVGLVIVFFIIMNNADYKYRFWRMFLHPLFTDPINLVMTSQYGHHYKVGLEVYNNHKLMGVGLKITEEKF